MGNIYTEDETCKLLPDSKGSRGIADESRRNHTLLADKQGPQCNFRNTSKTVAAYIAFFGGGINNAIIGATLLHLQHRTHTSVENISLLFTWRALGSLVGNLIMAAIFERTKPEIVLAAACIVLSAMNLAVPWCDSFIVLAAVIATNGFGHGALAGGCNGFVVEIWLMNSAPFIQALQFITSFGSAVTPEIVALFVVNDIHELELLSDNNYDNNNTLLKNNFSIYGNNDNFQGENAATDGSAYRYVDVFWDLFYSYTIAALIFLLAFLAFILNLLLDIFKQRSDSSSLKGQITISKGMESSTKKDRDNKKRNVFITLVMVLCVSYGSMECTYGGFILAFAVEYLGLSFDKASLIATFFWGFLATGRAIAVVTSKFVRPNRMIATSLTISMVTLIIITSGCTLHESVTLVGSIFVGLSFGPFFGDVISYSQGVIAFSGREVSLFVLSLYIGYIGMPAVVAYLFTKYTPMSLLYLMIVADMTACVVYICILLFEHKVIRISGVKL